MSTATPEPAPNTDDGAAGPPGRVALTVVAWLWVGLPFLYGVYALVTKLPALFT